MRDKLYKRGAVWWVNVRDERGRIVRKSTKCRDRLAAEGVARDYERKASNPAYAAAARSTLESCIADYFDELERRGVSPATLKKETTKVGHFVRLWPRDLPMAAINARRVYSYIERRESEKVTRHTVKMELGTLTRILKVARHHGLFHLPIEQVLPVKYGSGHKPRTRAPTPEEVADLLAQMTTARAAHIAFLVATGARLGESFRARRSDYRPDEGVIFLRGTKTEKAPRDVPITPIVSDLLNWSLEFASGTDLLFKPWGKLHRDLAVACKRAKIATVTPNDLRRAFATWHRKAGAVPSEIAQMLGHASSDMAEKVYSRINAGDVRKILVQRMTVLNLYKPALSEGEKVDVLDSQSTGKQAPPARFERATFALGKQRSDPDRVPVEEAKTPSLIADCVDFVHGRVWLDKAVSALLGLAGDRLVIS